MWWRSPDQRHSETGPFNIDTPATVDAEEKWSMYLEESAHREAILLLYSTLPVLYSRVPYIACN